jgi:uncharacterized protein
MRVLVLFSHPSQFLFYKNAISELRKRGHSFFVLIKTKDILVDLLKEEGWVYYNILLKERGKSKLQILWSLVVRDIKLLRFSRKHDIHMFMGTDASLAHIAQLFGRPCITTLEDDYTVIKKLADLTYPFSTNILVPSVCDVGKWQNKKIGYEGYMKLAYLHPKMFIPDRKKVIIKENAAYFIIRLSGLSAHHDFGIKGISFTLLDSIIHRLSSKGKVYISSEKILPSRYEGYCLKASIKDFHHYLYFSEILICDSQSTALEAAVLGVPSIRVSGFSGRISVLEELEHKYKLTFGIKPENEIGLFHKLDELLDISNLKEVFQIRRQKMLSEKIDITSFMVWFIENFPESARIMKENPEFQYNFL